MNCFVISKCSTHNQTFECNLVVFRPLTNDQNKLKNDAEPIQTKTLISDKLQFQKLAVASFTDTANLMEFVFS